MKLSIISSLVLSASCVVLAAAVRRDEIADAEAQFSALSEQALNATIDRLDAEEASLKKRGKTASCTVANLSIRREFGSLSQKERKAYTDAVLCLQSKPANTPAGVAAGAKTRFDDFIVTHIQQTLTIHYTGNFLSWHRYYIWVYEQALKNECGFQGSIPYWEWSKYSDAPQNSPIFNGDAYSMSGNGEYIPGKAAVILGVPGAADAITLTPGLGGGCVTTGPFKDYKVNLGPISVFNETTGPDGGYGYNPRCLKRDVGPGVSSKYNNWVEVLKVMAKSTIGDFQLQLQGQTGVSIGPHGGGHYTIGGDPGGDLFTSPGDPAFYVHHAQIDRLWTVWQALDPSKRTNAISGTNTYQNSPPSANTTLADILQFGYAGGDHLPIGDVMSTTAGPFCYIYL